MIYIALKVHLYLWYFGLQITIISPTFQSYQLLKEIMMAGHPVLNLKLSL